MVLLSLCPTQPSYKARGNVSRLQSLRALNKRAEVFLPGSVTARYLQRATKTRVLEAIFPGKSGPVHSPSCLGGGNWEVEKQAGQARLRKLREPDLVHDITAY